MTGNTAGIWPTRACHRGMLRARLVRSRLVVPGVLPCNLPTALAHLSCSALLCLSQIVNNVHRDARRSLHPRYIVGTSITRLAVPLYFFGCPQNFMRVTPSPQVCILLVLYMAAQASCLLLQHYCGPRCFIPRRFLPLKYDYSRPLGPNFAVANGEAERDCVICMSVVHANDRNRMATPCDHLFHSSCLLEWMEIKLECPTCRRPIPAP